MNTFNRILIVLACVVAILGLTTVFMAPAWVATESGKALTAWGKDLAAAKPFGRIAIGALLAIVVDAALVFLIVLELRTGRNRYLRVQQVKGDMVILSAESIIRQLQQKLDAMPGVQRVKPSIRTRGEKLSASVDVEVTPGANVPAMASELTNAVQSVITTDLGLQIHGIPEVRMRVAPTVQSKVKTAKKAAPASTPKTFTPTPEVTPEPVAAPIVTPPPALEVAPPPLPAEPLPPTEEVLHEDKQG